MKVCRTDLQNARMDKKEEEVLTISCYMIRIFCPLHRNSTRGVACCKRVECTSLAFSVDVISPFTTVAVRGTGVRVTKGTRTRKGLG